MFTQINAYRMALANRLRLRRILAEIDRPRKEAIAEARLCARQYQDLIESGKLDSMHFDQGRSAVGTAKQMKRR
jgi:uncharacterized membrane protein